MKYRYWSKEEKLRILNHKNALQKMLEIKIKKEYEYLETIFYNNQCVGYHFLPFNKTFDNTSITRFMYRVRTLTHNPKVVSSSLTPATNL